MMFAERVRTVGTIVYLDDDVVDLRACEEALRPRAVHTTTRVAALFDLVARVEPDLLLIDFFLGVQRGYAPDGSSRRQDSLALPIIRELRARHSSLQILVVSGGSCDPFRAAVKEAGADEMLHKLIGWKKIIDIVECDMLHSREASGSASLAKRTHTVVAQAYVDNDFNASKTARDLDIGRTTLYRRLKNAPQK